MLRGAEVGPPSRRGFDSAGWVLPGRVRLGGSEERRAVIATTDDLRPSDLCSQSRMHRFSFDLEIYGSGWIALTGQNTTALFGGIFGKRGPALIRADLTRVGRVVHRR